MGSTPFREQTRHKLAVLLGAGAMVLATGCGAGENASPGSGDAGSRPDGSAVSDAGGGADGRLDGSVDACAATPSGEVILGTAFEVYGGAKAVTVDSEDNAYVAGSYETDLAFPGFSFGDIEAPPATGIDAFVVRRAPGGDIEWVTPFSGDAVDEALAVATDSAGALYVAGASRSSSLTLGTQELTGPGSNIRFNYIAKLDAADGSVLWAQRILGPDGVLDFTDCNALAPSAGRLFVSCNFRGGALTYPVSGGETAEVQPLGATSEMVASLDPDTGEAIWVNRIGGSGSEDIVTGTIRPTAGGDVIVSGLYTGFMLIDDRDAHPDSLFAYSHIGNGWDGFFGLLDGATGDGLWARGFGNGTDSTTDGIRSTESGAAGDALVLAGSFSGGVDFDSGFSETAGSGTYVARFPMAQAPQPSWLVAFAGRMNSLAVDGCGRSIVAVTTTVPWSLGALSVNPGVFAVKIDDDGTPLWAEGVEGDPNTNVRIFGQSVAALSNGHTLFVGRFQGDAGTGPGGGGVGLLRQPFVVEYGP